MVYIHSIHVKCKNTAHPHANTIQRQDNTKYNAGQKVTCHIYKVFNLCKNTPGTAGGPGGHDRTLTVKSRKMAKNQHFFRKKNKI